MHKIYFILLFSCIYLHVCNTHDVPLQYVKSNLNNYEEDADTTTIDTTVDETTTIEPTTIETTADETTPDETTAIETTVDETTTIETTPDETTTIETTPDETTTIETTTILPENDESPQITVPNFGTAKGTVILTALERKPFYAYFSIPYATPPVGEKRFKNTEPWPKDKKWMDEDGALYDASYLHARCAQFSMLFTGITSGSEDCLHLSIYTRKNNTSTDVKDLPVMAFIHGGGYVSGDSSLYLPTKLMEHDMVVVTIQYRLATLGFLYSGTDNAPGNMGLMDQVTALRWIKDYISFFGGDKDRITVFGQSAGAASSSWMQLSPLTNAENNPERGQLISGVIPMSGSAMEHWTLDRDPFNSLKTHAQGFNPSCYKEGDTNDDMINCMRERDITEVVNAAYAVGGNDRYQGGLGFLGMSPVVQDSEAITVEKVIVELPQESLKAGRFLDIHTMMGSVRDEGSLVAGLAYEGFLKPHNYFNDTEFLKEDLIPTLISSFGIDDPTGSVANAMKLNFMANCEMGDLESMAPGLIDMTGMLFLKSGAWTMAHLMAKAKPEMPIYFYSFEFESDDSLFDWIFIGDPDMPFEGGVFHTDDLLYLFALPSYQDEREKLMSKRWSTLVYNFAAHGNPTPTPEKGIETWLPFNREDEYFMLITEELKMERDFTTRWKYHSRSSNESKFEEIPMPKPQTGNISNDEEGSSNKLVVNILGITIGFLCFVIIGMVFVFMKKRPLNLVV